MRVSFKWVSAAIFLVALLYGVGWVVKAVWFRPDNIALFFQRFPYQYAQAFPEQATKVRIPQASLISPYESLLNDPLSDPQTFWGEIESTVSGYDAQVLPAEAQFHLHNLSWVSRHLSQMPELASPHAALDPFEGTWPDFLYLMEVLHPVDDKTDAEAFVSRMKRFDQKVSDRFLQACVPLDTFHHRLALEQLARWQALPTNEHRLYKAFARKAIQADPTLLNEADASRLLREVSNVITEEINPTLGSMATYLEGMGPRTESDTLSGITPTHYEAYLTYYATGSLAPDSLHEASLKTWRRSHPLGKEMLAVPRFPRKVSPSLFRDSLIEAQQYLASMSEGLFERVPPAPLILRLSDSLFQDEGDYIFLVHDPKGQGEWRILWDSTEYVPVSFWEPFGVYYGVPGLHSLKAGSWRVDEPQIFRQYLEFPAFEKGWALYAVHILEEQLHIFSRDSLAHAGYNYLMDRALYRCILDTGIHGLGWSRREGLGFLERETRLPPKQAIREVERILHTPGYYSAAWVGLEQMKALQHLEAQNRGADFVLQDFLTEIIQIGPGTFPAVKARLLSGTSEK